MKTLRRFFLLALAAFLLLSLAACAPEGSGTGNGGDGSGDTGIDLISSIVNDAYYKDLMQKMEETTWQSGLYATPAYDPHPYSFLESQGIDVNKILDGTYKAKTLSYVLDNKPNELNISTRVLIDDSYWHAFLITYKLTDKEMQDYKSAHGTPGSYSDYQWPAFFMNDKISELKTPIKAEETKYTKATQDEFNTYHNKTYNNTIGFILSEINNNDNNYNIIYYTTSSSNYASTTNKIVTTKLITLVLEPLNGIYSITNANSYTINSREEAQGTTFSTQDCSIMNAKEPELTQ